MTVTDHRTHTHMKVPIVNNMPDELFQTQSSCQIQKACFYLSLFTFTSSLISQLVAFGTQTLVPNFEIVAYMGATTFVVQTFIGVLKETTGEHIAMIYKHF